MVSMDSQKVIISITVFVATVIIVGMSLWYSGAFTNKSVPYNVSEDMQTPSTVEPMIKNISLLAEDSSPNNTPRSSERIIRASSEVTEEDIQAGMKVLESVDCGKNFDDRVSNGNDVRISQFAWMALLIYDDGLSRSIDCGGSLITSRYVLTAAHCIRFGGNTLVSVRLGEHDINEDEDCQGVGKSRQCAPPVQEIDVAEAIYHKDFNPAAFSDDIGLIRLVSEVTFLSNIQTVCLPVTPASQININQMIILGWGQIANGVRASILQKAFVPVRSNDFCQKSHEIIKVTDKHICVGGENEVGTCRGDSGGPLFYGARYRLGIRYIQYGIFSAGSLDCGTNYPSVNVRVLPYLPWVAGNLRP